MLLSQHKGGIFSKNTISLSDIIADVKKSNNYRKGGAIFTFTGIVRETSLLTTDLVEKIIIESWDEKVFEEMNKICQELQQKYALVDIRIWHATGKFTVGEELVHIVAVSQHRKNGLLAIEEGINLYKTRAPIWKKEIYQNGKEKWISGGENVRNIN